MSSLLRTPITLEKEPLRRNRGALLFTVFVLAQLIHPVQAARPWSGQFDEDSRTLSVASGGKLKASRRPPLTPFAAESVAATAMADWFLPHGHSPEASLSEIGREERSGSNRTSHPNPTVEMATKQGEPPSHSEKDDNKDVCNKEIFARSDVCPEGCPYAAEVQQSFCTFKCVKAVECGLGNTVQNATIPDEHLHACRHCEVEGCRKCVPSRPGEQPRAEHCDVCMPGYIKRDGECRAAGDIGFIVAGLVAALAVLLFLVWCCYVASRPVVNEEGLAYALECRDRMRLAQPSNQVASGRGNSTGDESGSTEASNLLPTTGGHFGVARIAGTAKAISERQSSAPQPWPLTTNLMTTNVAGPGTLVLFRFEFAILVWASVLLIFWLALAAFVSSDLLVLGTKPATTPMQLCAVVKWGRERQLELLWTKVLWLSFAYVFSFAGAIYYGIQQAKLFTKVDNEQNTMSDYAATLEGFTPVKGLERPEETLKEEVVRSLGLAEDAVVGVSVSWQFASVVDELEHLLDKEMDAAEPSGQVYSDVFAGDESRGVDSHDNANGGMFEALFERVLGAWHVHLDDDRSGGFGHRQDPMSVLGKLQTARKAFVVFRTETERDQAVARAKEQAVLIDGVKCTLTEEHHEPEGVLWKNLHMTREARIRKYLVGYFLVTLTCIGWTVLLYLPYAHYMSSFSYANGDEPGMMSEGIFIGLVVGSQFGIFAASSAAARMAAHHFEDQKQKMYMMCYNGALILNLVMDIVLQTVLSYLQMVGVGAHVVDGRLLGSLTSWQQIFESYPVQKSVGKLLFKYCWPCTFLLPFAIEPFAVQWLPFHLGKMLVRADTRLQGRNAEKTLELGEMEQGRYADCIFNAVLVACIPFIAPAYMHRTFIVLVISHLYIYAYDQVKTLRCVVRFYFSSKEVHWFGQKLFALPVGVLAAALVFKGNQMSARLRPEYPADLGQGFLQGYALGAACMGAFLVHCFLHMGILECWVSSFEHAVERKSADETYAECARRRPCTYFSANPVQCLRSKYVLEEDPPLSYFRVGKEHLMKASPKSGAYYDGCAH